MRSTILKWTANLIFSVAGWIIVWALRLSWRLAWWLGRKAIQFPRTSVGFGVLGAAVIAVGWETLLIVLGILVLAGSTWKAAHRESFDRIVGTWMNQWWRHWWTYSRVWTRVMARSGLTVEVDGEREIPRLRRVEVGRYWDHVTAQLAEGQEVADFVNVQHRLRHAYRAERIRVREIKPASVGIDFMRVDPFRHETVPAAPMPATTAEIDWTALLVGLTEHLEPLRVSVVGGHLAGAGGSGAGKAGIEWNILRAVAPALADGTVRPVFIDPKGRELRQGRELLADEKDYAVKDTDVLDLLQRMVGELEAVNERAGEAGERDFQPSPRTPLTLIFIDELAPLLAYWKRSIRDKVEDALGIILTQGRAAGYIVVGLIQEPTKDVFTIRDLFARRLALRLPTEAHTDAALGEHAVDRGAACHDIPEDLPGVLYALANGEKHATRARLGHVKDEDIEALVEFVTSRRAVTSIDSRRSRSTADAAA
jgi:S-DNA-T family DNA segregation ATPase FtsK/SpoIIIE